LLLFGCFADLNAAIFALAWSKSWRALNAVGFVFTFVLGLAWGREFYDAAHYAIVQPFLALFFAFYVGIAILNVRRAPPTTRDPGDGLLVFGVPVVGFALQAALVREYHHGVAWSAVAIAAFYAVLFVATRKRADRDIRPRPRVCCAGGHFCDGRDSVRVRTIATRPRSGRSRRPACTGSACGRNVPSREPSPLVEVGAGSCSRSRLPWYG
jgi:hypothetical protein